MVSPAGMLPSALQVGYAPARYVSEEGTSIRDIGQTSDLGRLTQERLPFTAMGNKKYVTMRLEEMDDALVARSRWKAPAHMLCRY